MKRTTAGAFNSIFLRAGDVERSQGPMQPCYVRGGERTTKRLQCGTQYHEKCNSVTRNVAANCQPMNSSICIHCNSNAGDRERCSVCGKDFKLHQYRAMCNICSSPCHLACTQLPRNDRDNSKTGTNNGPAILIVLYPVNHPTHFF